MNLTQEDLKSFVECQLATWPLAKNNYDSLAQCLRKRFDIGNLSGAVQFNPARIASTGADTSASAVAARTCFLCAANRPEEQLSVPLESGWLLLVNPFPIFPMHFTIVAEQHVPQQEVPFEIASIAEKMEGMTVFYNGPRAGASAPDHAHLQAVLTEELPLMRLIEKCHTPENTGIRTGEDLGLNLPFSILSAVIAPTPEGMADMVRMFRIDGELLNFFAFVDYRGYLHLVAVPRKAHRPDCYFADGDARLLVSPGSIDMAGVVITPRKEDFEKIESDDIALIYSQTGLPPQELPSV